MLQVYLAPQENRPSPEPICSPEAPFHCIEESFNQAFTIDSIGTMEHFFEKLSETVYGVYQACVPLEVKIRWSPEDAQQIASELRFRNTSQQESFIQFVQSIKDAALAGQVLGGLALDYEGAQLAAKLISKIEDPVFFQEVLFSIADPMKPGFFLPARAARVLNAQGTYLIPEREAPLDEKMVREYQIGIGVDADQCLGGDQDLIKEYRDKVLSVFDKYDASIERDALSLHDRLLELKATGVIDACYYDFTETRRIEAGIRCYFCSTEGTEADPVQERASEIEKAIALKKDAMTEQEQLFAKFLKKVFAQKLAEREAEGRPAKTEIEDWGDQKEITEVLYEALEEIKADQEYNSLHCQITGVVGCHKTTVSSNFDYRGLHIQAGIGFGDRSGSINISREINGVSYGFDSKAPFGMGAPELYRISASEQLTPESNKLQINYFPESNTVTQFYEDEDGFGVEPILQPSDSPLDQDMQAFFRYLLGKR